MWVIFSQLSSHSRFVVSLGKQQLIPCLQWRPVLPIKLYGSLKKLISKCWDANPDNRPDFNQIVNELNGPIREEVMLNPEPMFSYTDEDYAAEDTTEVTNNEETTLLKNYNELKLELDETKHTLEVVTKENLELVEMTTRLERKNLHTKDSEQETTTES